MPDSSAPGYPLSNITSDRRLPLKASFGPGFQFETEDEEFRLQVHSSPRSRRGSGGRKTRSPGSDQRLLPAPPADLLQRQHHQADRVRVLDQPRAGQPQPAERLHQSSLRRPLRGPLRPLLHAAPLRPVRDLELLAADARAVAVHDQRRPEPPVRADGLGLPLRQAARLRGRRLQRLAQLVREPQQRRGFRRRTSTPGRSRSRSRCRSPGS